MSDAITLLDQPIFHDERPGRLNLKGQRLPASIIRLEDEALEAWENYDFEIEHHSKMPGGYTQLRMEAARRKACAADDKALTARRLWNADPAAYLADEAAAKQATEHPTESRDLEGYDE